MVRVKCIIQYDGTNYNGSQIQPGLPTIYGELQKALKKIHKKDIIVTSAGRTDANVHALAQVIHFDSELDLEANNYRHALNCLLPKDIRVIDASIEDENFHARFSSHDKEYIYKLSMAPYSIFERNHIYQFGQKLDVEAMKEACKLFLGTHDFRNFCTTTKDETNTYIRTLFLFEINQENDLLIFKIRGNGFLRYMVRMMIGMLIKIGLHKVDKSLILEKFDIENCQQKCPYKAPAEGLYLNEVKYD